jgi:hypothetical protein
MDPVIYTHPDGNAPDLNLTVEPRILAPSQTEYEHDKILAASHRPNRIPYSCKAVRFGPPEGAKSSDLAAIAEMLAELIKLNALESSGSGEGGSM